jgi:hypothetical protein
MDKKKMDQRIVGVYTVVGAVAGLLAQYLTPISIQLALIIPFSMYLASLAVFVRGTRGKERNRVIFNSFLTLFLVWATVWVFFFNL